MGIMIESESDAEMEMSEEESYAPPLFIVDQLHRPFKSRNLFEVEPLLDRRNPDHGHRTLDWVSPRTTNRPTKNELIGNLLSYQCRNNKRRFGSAHQEVARKTSDVDVSTWTEQVIRAPNQHVHDFGTLENRLTSTTFKEFIGMPEIPLLTTGKGTDELEYKEGKHEGRDNAFGTPRAKRVRNEVRFPFVFVR
jgi:hypothetical protein